MVWRGGVDPFTALQGVDAYCICSAILSECTVTVRSSISWHEALVHIQIHMSIVPCQFFPLKELVFEDTIKRDGYWYISQRSKSIFLCCRAHLRTEYLLKYLQSDSSPDPGRSLEKQSCNSMVYWMAMRRLSYPGHPKRTLGSQKLYSEKSTIPWFCLKLPNSSQFRHIITQSDHKNTRQNCLSTGAFLKHPPKWSPTSRST